MQPQLSLLSLGMLLLLSLARYPFTNVLAVIAQYMILLAFMAALMISTGSTASFGMSNFGLGVILTLANGAIVGLALFIG